jgi:hypothetical protein
MKNVFLFSVIFFISALTSCRSTRHINEAIGAKDTPIVNTNAADSIRMVQETIATFKSNHIDFKTFSAKIKVESSGNKGKNPDITAVVRMIKDSAIWMSLSATFLNYEAYRVLITKDSVILLNKQDKEVQYRSMDYLQEITEIPFDFHTLQELIIGNPVFFSDSISSFKQLESQYMVSSVGGIFKNLLTLTKDRKLIALVLPRTLASNACLSTSSLCRRLSDSFNLLIQLALILHSIHRYSIETHVGFHL